MSWGRQQEAALKQVAAWLKDTRGPQIFRLFGYAGSGKTTMAKHIADQVAGSVLFAAFTGKAALCLRKKGCEGASTIHSLIYKAEQDPATGEFNFHLNRDGGAATASLIVIDEVSMVGEDLALDLLSFGKKVLVLGDPAQLPPVKGEGYFINAEPDVMLTEVHRQAQDNPIIRMSMDIREGRSLQPGQYGTSLVVESGTIDKDAMRQIVLDADQLLCGLNRTRHQFNARIRWLKGLADPGMPWMPSAGDRLVCLRNDREKGLLNGGLWTVDKLTPAGKRIGMRVSSLDVEGAAPIDIEVPPEFFKGTEKDLHWRERREADEFCFGWALTCHKSQGSQFDNVVVFDESRSFREDAAKWLYTACTRASERVTIVI